MRNPFKAYWKALTWCMETKDCGGIDTMAARGKAVIAMALVGVPFCVIVILIAVVGRFIHQGHL